MPIRLTDNVDRSRQLYKGYIYGWALFPGCIPAEHEGEFVFDHLPLVICIYFPEAALRVGDLPVGVYPLKPKSRTWKVNKYTGIEARRTGFWILLDFASTAHMIQGATLDAAFADLQSAGCKVSTVAQIAAYVCLSRVKQLCHICILHPFSTFLFARGPPVGPERLIRRWSKQITEEEAYSEWVDDNATDLQNTDAPKSHDVTSNQLLCTSCYLQGKQNYKLAASHFWHKKGRRFLPHVSLAGKMDEMPAVPESFGCVRFAHNAAHHLSKHNEDSRI